MSKTVYEPDLVIDDDLLIQYYDFIRGKKGKDATISALLYHYRHEHLTNIAQLERIGMPLPVQVVRQLAQRPERKYDLEELAKLTKYKVILSQKENPAYPYLNIFNDVYDNTFTAAFKRHEVRDKAFDHLKALCRNASKIWIYDNFFNRSLKENVETLKRFLPQKKLLLTYPEGQLEEIDINDLHTFCPYWSFAGEKLVTHHDRYIIIDNKIEVILTSGFINFSETTKDCTYIVREIDSNFLIPKI